MSAIDLHQHLWSEEFVDRLRARSRAPFLRGWTLHLDGERPYRVDPDDHDPELRRDLDVASGVGAAVVGVSAPLGIESLAGPHSETLLAAHHRGVRALPAHFRGWASVRTDATDPQATALPDLFTDERFVGLQLPATALLTPGAWERAGPLLDFTQRAGRAVFVHPGPEPRRPAAPELPSWWAPTLGYSTQLQAAWWAWHAADARRSHPGLPVLFAAGAGLAPLLAERQALRDPSGDLARGTVDPLLFLDTSGHGPRALEALVRSVGLDALALGSDRPYGAPLDHLLDPAATHAVRITNPRRLLGASLGRNLMVTDTRSRPTLSTTSALPAEAAAALTDFDAGLVVADLPRRDLEPAELAAVAAAIAQQPDTWRHLVGFDDDERVFASLHRDAHVDIWLLCWTPVNDTGWHDHDVSSGAVAVVDGALIENNLTLAQGARETRVEAGSVFAFGPDHIHRLNGARAGSVSVHAYSPPLWRMGQYSVDDAGVLRRTSLSYAEELRPID